MNLSDKHLMQITRDNSSHVSRDYFNEHYGFPGIPVVFSHAFQDMPVKEKWDFSYLRTVLQEPEHLEVLGGSNETKIMTLAEYMLLRDPSLYYKTSRHVNNALAGDFTTPGQFSCWYANTTVGNPRNRLSWLYVGMKDTFSELHRDIWWTSAWNYLIRGRKLWLIYPAAYTPGIEANMDAYKLKGQPGRLLDGDGGIYKPLICIQEEGELIFVPGNCYHSVINLDDTISLTENFMNETNYDMVRMYFRKGSNTNNIRMIDDIIKEGFLNMKDNINTIPYENKN